MRPQSETQKVRTIGLIGGISWHSTAVYYSEINRLIAHRLGPYHSARLLLYSVNYHDFKLLQDEDDWNQIENILTKIANKLEQAGAECILIACNAAHLIADALSSKISVPFLHIAEATANEVMSQGLKKVGLIGTRFAMEAPFYADRFKKRKIQMLLPQISDREFIHQAILTELSRGETKADTKVRFLKIIENLEREGAEAVVLACTEIGLLIKDADPSVKLLDTTFIHLASAVDFSLT